MVDVSRNLQQQALIEQMQASQPAAHWRFSLKLTTRSFACAKQENLLQQHAELKEQLELTQSFLVIPRSLLSRSHLFYFRVIRSTNVSLLSRSHLFYHRVIRSTNVSLLSRSHLFCVYRHGSRMRL